MKKIFNVTLTLVVSIVLVLAMNAIVFAADKGEIVVSGNGIVTVDPDVATLYLSIDTNAATAEEAQSQNAEISASVIEAMKSFGVKDDSIKTRSYRVNPRYKYDNNGEDRKLTGYDVSNSLSVVTSDVNNTGKYLDAAVKAGATGNDGVEFSVKDPTKQYGKALTLAITNAKSSATTIAETLGVKLGNPVKVMENYTTNSYVRQDMAYSGMAKAENAPAAGGADIRYDKIEITANVSMTYQY